MCASDVQFVERSSCPLCLNRRLLEHDRTKDRLVEEINRFLPPDEPRLPSLENIRRRCRGCGLIFLSPRLSDTSLRLVQRLWYAFVYPRVFGGEEMVAERQRELQKHHLRYLQRASKSPGTLLDLGCGSGLFLEVARRAGWTAVGVELDTATVEAGRVCGAEIHAGTLAQTIEHTRLFDAVVMFDYLEHVADTALELELALSHLRPGGVLLVRVPNAAGWQARWMGRRWLGILCNHLVYFDAAVLCNALSSRGLRVESVSAHNYQTEAEILRFRWKWVGSRLASTAPVNDLPAGVRPLRPGSSMAWAAGRFAQALLLEQLDHAGGWFQAGNNLMVVARRI